MSDARRSVSFRLAEYLPYRLSVAAHAVATLIAAAHRQGFGLPAPQWRVLAIVNEHGALSQQQIVPLSTMDKQMVSRAARALQQRGLLRRSASRADRRAVRLELSARGRAVFGRLAPMALHYELQLLQGMSTRESRSLRRALRNLQVRAEDARQRLVRGGSGPGTRS